MSLQASLPIKAAFPFGDSISGVFGLKTRKEWIKTALSLILTTPKGTLVYDPDFGSQIPYLVFEILEPTVINLIYYYIEKELREQLPQIRVTSIRVDYKPPRQVSIWVGYKDRNDPNGEQEEAPLSFSIQGTNNGGA